MNKWKRQHSKSCEDENFYPNFSTWVRSIGNKHTFAGCRFYHGSIIDVSNIVVQALKNHWKSKKHAKASALVASNTPTTFFQKQSTKIKTNLKESATKSSANSSGHSTASQSAINSNSMRDASVAELLWAIKLVVSHHLLRNCYGLSDLLANIFPDTNVANEFSMRRTKLSYISSNTKRLFSSWGVWQISSGLPINYKFFSLQVSLLLCF